MSSLSLNWSSLDLNEKTLHACNSLGFNAMTPIQSATIPLLSGNRDIIAEAVTGSGKTLAFLIPLLNKLIHLNDTSLDSQILGLILTPTRELASQTITVWNNLSKDVSINCNAMLAIGGQKSLKEDLESIRSSNVRVLIGTPGRTLDLLENGFSCKHLEILILDEADHLLDLGFQNTLQSILSYLPKQRRTGLFSATMSDAIESFLKLAGLRNVARITVKAQINSKVKTEMEQRAPTSLSNFFCIVEPKNKFSLLMKILSRTQYLKCIIFFGTCACVDYFEDIFKKLDFQKTLIALHGKQSLAKREKRLKDFEAKDKSILLTTDVAARGLDFDCVDLVIQYDPPLDPKTYSHRSGRAARAGKIGKSIIILNQGREEQFVQMIKIKSIPIEELEIETSDLEEETTKNNQKLRKLLNKEREFYEKSAKAFVSFIQSYRKHQANYIFRLKDLDIAGVAESMSLLHLPSMPEIKQLKQENLINFKGYDFVDNTKIPYIDKQREKARKRKLELGLPSRGSRKKPTTQPAWSLKKDRKLAKSDRKIKKETVAKEKNTKSQVYENDDDELDKDWKEYVLEKKNNRK